jgi:heme-degrading monooxygenase HmoA
VYVAMNRFTIKPEHADDFERAWQGRQTHLMDVPGVKTFRLLRHDAEFISLSEWDSRDHFEAWTRSEAFDKAHSQSDTRSMHERGPRFTGYDVVIDQRFEYREGR